MQQKCLTTGKEIKMEKEIKYKTGKKKAQIVLAVVAFVLLCIFYSM